MHSALLVLTDEGRACAEGEEREREETVHFDFVDVIKRFWIKDF